MALPPLASVAELEGWLGITASPVQRAEAILAAASTLVRTHSGRSWVDADGEPEEALSETQLEAAKTVVLAVTGRVWRNPSGLTQEVVGPFSRSIAAWAAMGLELTDSEKQMISVSDGIPGLASIRVVAPALASASRWADLDDLQQFDTDE